MKKRYDTFWDLACPDTYKVEISFILAVLIHPETLIDVKDYIRDDYFADADCAATWRKIVQLKNDGEDIDFVSITLQLPAKLRDNLLQADSASIASTKQLANALYASYLKRIVFTQGHEMVRLATSEASGVEDMLAVPEMVSKAFSGIDDVASDESLQHSIDSLGVELEQGNETRIPTAIKALDNILNGGFEQGELVIIAARPSVGKTALMLQIARNMAEQKCNPTLFSLEMRNKDIAKRMTMMTEKITPSDYFQRDAMMWERFQEAKAELAGVRMSLFDNVYHIDVISNLIIRKTAKGSKAIFIDYLGLITDGNRDERKDLRLAEITGRLKQIAKKCSVPVVLLCQLNRDADKAGRSPELFDLRDSGGIEQDADIVLMLERPKGTDDGSVDVWVRKNRNGLAGDIRVKLVGKNGYTKFYERDDYDD